MSFVDDCTRFVWYYPLRNKTKFYKVYVLFEKMIYTQFDCKIKVFHSYGGGEFSSIKFKNHLADNGTMYRFTYPYTPQQAGIVERRHRSIVEISFTQPFHAKLPLVYWNESFQIAIFLLNRLPSKALPDEAFPFPAILRKHKVIPHLGFLATFGTIA